MHAFVRLFLIIALGSLPIAQYASSDPISRGAAAVFESGIHSKYKIPYSVDLLEWTKNHAESARNAWKLDPASRELMRDLGDALHLYGHILEHRYLYDLALQTHQESLSFFKQSGLASAESWDDGVDHAKEHIFMDIYDKGVLTLHQGDAEASEKLFEAAYQWSEEAQLPTSTLSNSNRFLNRYLPLLKARGEKLKAMSTVAIKSIGDSCKRVVQKAKQFLDGPK